MQLDVGAIHLISIVLFCSTVWVAKAANCTTPNGERAECISIHKCPILLEAIKTSEKWAIDFAKKSQCGYTEAPLVCCGKVNNYTQSSIALLPTLQYCGFQHSDDYYTDRTQNSGSSSIDEFPWLAALIYDREDKEVYLCAGALISNRYVLTAAHCLTTEKLVKPLHLKRVRLGEYNIEQIQDCVSNGGLNECSDPTAEFGVEEIIINDKYNSNLHLHDVGLLRLNTTVQYSDYIRPICLPLPGSPRARIGDILSGSGWGKTSYVGKDVKIKKKVLAKLISFEECSEYYKKMNHVIREGQICTKYNQRNSTSTCIGDSGAPIMYQQRNQWFQEGIVSFGGQCGSETPDVHMKVADYVDWILRTIRA